MRDKEPASWRWEKQELERTVKDLKKKVDDLHRQLSRQQVRVKMAGDEQKPRVSRGSLKMGFRTGITAQNYTLNDIKFNLQLCFYILHYQKESISSAFYRDMSFDLMYWTPMSSHYFWRVFLGKNWKIWKYHMGQLQPDCGLWG